MGEKIRLERMGDPEVCWENNAHPVHRTCLLTYAYDSRVDNDYYFRKDLTCPTCRDPVRYTIRGAFEKILGFQNLKDRNGNLLSSVRLNQAIAREAAGGHVFIEDYRAQQQAQELWDRHQNWPPEEIADFFFDEDEIIRDVPDEDQPEPQQRIIEVEQPMEVEEAEQPLEVIPEIRYADIELALVNQQGQILNIQARIQLPNGYDLAIGHNVPVPLPLPVEELLPDPDFILLPDVENAIPANLAPAFPVQRVDVDVWSLLRAFVWRLIYFIFGRAIDRVNNFVRPIVQPLLNIINTPEALELRAQAYAIVEQVAWSSRLALSNVYRSTLELATYIHAHIVLLGHHMIRYITGAPAIGPQMPHYMAWRHRLSQVMLDDSEIVPDIEVMDRLDRSESIFPLGEDEKVAVVYSTHSQNHHNFDLFVVTITVALISVLLHYWRIHMPESHFKTHLSNNAWVSIVLSCVVVLLWILLYLSYVSKFFRFMRFNMGKRNQHITRHTQISSYLHVNYLTSEASYLADEYESFKYVKVHAKLLEYLYEKKNGQKTSSDTQRYMHSEAMKSPHKDLDRVLLNDTIIYAFQRVEALRIRERFHTGHASRTRGLELIKVSE
jgi:hypothetical protein